MFVVEIWVSVKFAFESTTFRQNILFAKAVPSSFAAIVPWDLECYLIASTVIVL